MHAIEKILANAAGVDSVKTGEIVNCEVDITGINDLYLQVVYSFFEMGGEKVKKPDGVVIFLDHYAPASSIKQAENQKAFRKFSKDQGIKNLMEINEGVCHQVMADKAFSKPGQVIIITDSHTTTHGAFGAFGTGVGATDAAISILTGKLWFKIPEIIKINLEGTLQKGVYAKDIILKIIGDLGADYGVYKAVEFTGSLVKDLTMADRMTICNMTTEMGAKAAYIQPDDVTIAHLEKVGAADYKVYTTDDDFTYDAEHNYDVSDIVPQIAVPHSVDNVENIQDCIGEKIDQAFLGTCTGGRIEDIREAAKILKGKKINSETRMLVVPASKNVLKLAISEGLLEILIDAGATMVTPGCAACLGTHEGILAEGESCISSANRNFPGRMGHRKAKVYLSSPAVVAASAIAGKIVLPTDYL